MNYPVLVGLGHDAFSEAYDAVFAIPVTWFIRPDGTVLLKHQGPRPRSGSRRRSRRCSRRRRARRRNDASAQSQQRGWRAAAASAFRDGVEGSPVTVVIARKSAACAHRDSRRPACRSTTTAGASSVHAPRARRSSPTSKRARTAQTRPCRSQTRRLFVASFGSIVSSSLVAIRLRARLLAARAAARIQSARSGCAGRRRPSAATRRARRDRSEAGTACVRPWHVGCGPAARRRPAVTGRSSRC